MAQAQTQAAPFEPKFLTIGQLENEKSSSVFVMNTSNPKGNVTVTVPDGMGNSLTVLVPVTWIPIDLTTQSTKNSLLNSPIFRRMLTKKMLSIISEADAEKMMQSAEAQKEHARIYNMTQEITQAAGTLPPEIASMQDAEGGNVSGFALNIAHADNLEEGQVLNSVKGNENTLSQDDMKYIVANSKHPKVKAYLAEKMVQPA